jgi:hypothetical protein
MSQSIRSAPSEVHSHRYGPPHSRHLAAGPRAIYTRAAVNPQTAIQARSVINPLWAINIGMAAFFAAAALVVVLG